MEEAQGASDWYWLRRAVPASQQGRAALGVVREGFTEKVPFSLGLEAQIRVSRGTGAPLRRGFPRFCVSCFSAQTCLHCGVFHHTDSLSKTESSEPDNRIHSSQLGPTRNPV